MRKKNGGNGRNGKGSGGGISLIRCLVCLDIHGCSSEKWGVCFCGLLCRRRRRCLIPWRKDLIFVYQTCILCAVKSQILFKGTSFLNPLDELFQLLPPDFSEIVPVEIEAAKLKECC
jgi:hypothetical protein